MTILLLAIALVFASTGRWMAAAISLIVALATIINWSYRKNLR